MLKILFILLLLFIFPSSSHAQNPEALCSFLPAENSSRAAVGAAYVPGVDVHGNAVAPADLGGGQSFLPDVIRIPLSIDLAQELDQDLPDGTQMEAGLGMIEIYQDGRVLFDGRDLTAQADRLCGRGAPAQAPAAPPERETASAPVVSLDKTPPLVQKGQPALPAPVEPQSDQPYSGEEIWGEGY